MSELKKGITTGTCASAAAKAASILLSQGEKVSETMITLPSGGMQKVNIKSVKLIDAKAEAIVIKDGGDDPDVTHGAEIIAVAEWCDSYELCAGIGIGKVTKPGLAVLPGEAAINPVPRAMIKTAVHEVISQGNVKITISVPNGETLAKRTLNPKLGILGGISILGTTGIVEPMSEEAYKNSLAPQLDIAKSAGFQNIVFVPGKMGENSVSKYISLHEDEVAQTSNFIGFMLEEAVKRGFKKILLWGHIAKIIKVSAGNMHTHNRVSDARFETLTAHAALLGRCDLAEQLMSCNTAEEAVGVLASNGAMDVLMNCADSARKRAQDHLFGDAEIAVVFTNLKGDAIAWSCNIEQFLEDARWQKKFMW